MDPTRHLASPPEFRLSDVSTALQLDRIMQAREREHAATERARRAQFEAAEAAKDTTEAVREVAAHSKELAESSRAQPGIQWRTAIVSALVGAVVGAVLSPFMSALRSTSGADAHDVSVPSGAAIIKTVNACVPDVPSSAR
jgi:hypothetical protein